MKLLIWPLTCFVILIIGFTACNNDNNSIVVNKPKQSDRKKVAEFYYPVIYDSIPSPDGQWGFQTIPATSQRVKLVPNIQTCETLGLNHINNIFGVNQFLLDMDLSNGFVHRYTTNFFNQLSLDEYVLKYEKIAGKELEGIIRFIRKKDLKTTDTLGKNLAYFRQWHLSEIVNGDSVEMQPCGYAKSYLCPQAKSNHYKEIAISNYDGKPGFQSFTKFNKLSDTDGGTVCIIWEDIASGEIFFKDVHGSLSRIINEAKKIATTENTDPVIAISDAGIVSRKFRAENFVLDLSPIKQLAPHSLIAAGYGYVAIKYTVYEVYEEGKLEKLDTVREEF